MLSSCDWQAVSFSLKLSSGGCMIPVGLINAALKPWGTFIQLSFSSDFWWGGLLCFVFLQYCICIWIMILQFSLTLLIWIMSSRWLVSVLSCSFMLVWCSSEFLSSAWADNTWRETSLIFAWSIYTIYSNKLLQLLILLSLTPLSLTHIFVFRANVL